MKIAIVQPYCFPYIGYFQLVNAVDTFVFFDDVNFIKKGFINRNSLLFNNKKQRFTIPCKSISQNKKINETELHFDTYERQKFLKTCEISYKNAPFFEVVFPMIESFVLNEKDIYISTFAAKSVELVAKYLDINTIFKYSSSSFNDSIHFKKTERIIQIVKKENATHYINPIGGKVLYDKAEFQKQGIELSFIKSETIKYRQFDNEFVPCLSIIDTLMFNSKSRIKEFLNLYVLE